DAQLLSLSWNEAGRRSSLSQLWLVAFRNRKPYRTAAENRQGLYLATGFVVNPTTRDKYGRTMDDRRLDSVVVDMKDDFGRLRFVPNDPLLRRMGKVANPLDVESFVAQWKAKGRYLIARIPVFKDQVVYEYDGGKYAVWDSVEQAPWRGVVTRKLPPAPTVPAPSGTGPGLSELPSPPATPQTESDLMKEYWVDPYSEDVWAYNVAIANEIIARGFDEVQFDYIRFPTDGENIDNASYRWRDPGMDKESALASFLSYARENIAAPISIDIYGANGWYRSGVRTGQDVELLAKYVDVICPMLYPSHFEQDFLAQSPATERPYRIYHIGTLRTYYMARKRVVVRPYVQAFYMNVKYDRQYYNLDYVKREVAGVRDSINLGMTFWNNGGRYDDVPVLELDPNGKLIQEGAATTGAGSDILN
ncbi:MAG TPA: putative glycoside hydrolase, partial [Rectinemataceae bacterium]|nr:putative glycoside hydrolase [Rectinemataceae bacterium]